MYNRTSRSRCPGVTFDMCFKNTNAIFQKAPNSRRSLHRCPILTSFPMTSVKTIYRTMGGVNIKTIFIVLRKSVPFDFLTKPLLIYTMFNLPKRHF